MDRVDIEQPAKCGDTWDAPDVELYTGSEPAFPISYVARYQGAFGRYCSGTMISPDLFVTANHDGCPVEPGESKCGCLVTMRMVPCDRSFWHYSGVDVSIARLTGAPGHEYGFVFPAARPLAVGNDIAIFQHPVGRGRRKVVGFGSVGPLSNSNMKYAIDTTGGSSGAGILDLNGLLVGVHRANGCQNGGTHNNGTPMTAIVGAVPQIQGIISAAWSVVL